MGEPWHPRMLEDYIALAYVESDELKANADSC